MELAAQRPGIVARLRDLPTVLRLAVVVLVAVAAARPQSTRAHDDLELEGIDIVITLDLSGSMQETDLAPNRLEAAKSVIREFVRKRPTDRIGMVVFGREAYTYVPLTLDHGTLLRMLAELRLGIVDGNGTAIGNGIGVALNRLCSEELTALRRARPEQGEGATAAQAKPPAPVATGPDGKPRSRVIIVLTDGDNNAGNVSPEDAARWAQLLNVKIYTVLAGDNDARRRSAGRRPPRRRTPSCSSRSRRPPAARPTWRPTGARWTIASRRSSRTCTSRGCATAARCTPSCTRAFSSSRSRCCCWRSRCA